ncbi:TlpA family protein disulfide reductase [Candidatus Laterigemmans baculatus]|uniref:TlpA family protein disulfide reductase n=1 Tax=Candidatus Laterigemmans baculatus TaxID=2770505 RepID=UPI0013DCE165|nr:TlpA disulfide reductase family protein [Candidatus Laterigemmans baculatus]
MRSALLFLLLLLVAVAAYLAFAPKRAVLPPAGTYGPFDFTLVSTEGETVSLDDFAGQVVIVDVWGTWCTPCRMGIPHFVELQDEYREEGLRIVGINYEMGTPDEALAAIEKFTSEVPVNYPLLIGDDATGAQIPGFGTFPNVLFIDRQGKIRHTLVGLHSKEELEAVAKPLLEEASQPTQPLPQS